MERENVLQKDRDTELLISGMRVRNIKRIEKNIYILLGNGDNAGMAIEVKDYKIINLNDFSSFLFGP